MKMTGRFNFLIGFLSGALLFGGATVFAAGIAALPSTHKIFVNGAEVKIETYLIEGRNYVQLRDIAKSVGFSVVWDSENDKALIDTSRDYDSDETLARQSEQDQVHELELEVIKLVNEEREKAGLGRIAINMDLCKIARVKSIEMLESGYFSHTSPTYGTPSEMASKFGVKYTGIGENLGYSKAADASRIVNSWMNSESHKENLLNPKHKEAGVGIATSEDGTVNYWTLLLIY